MILKKNLLPILKIVLLDLIYLPKLDLIRDRLKKEEFMSIKLSTRYCNFLVEKLFFVWH